MAEYRHYVCECGYGNKCGKKMSAVEGEYYLAD